MNQLIDPEISYRTARLFRTSAILLGTTALIAGCGKEKSTTGCVSDTPEARTNPLAQRVTQVIREHGISHFDAGIKVICGTKQTIAPVTATNKGSTYYFKLQGTDNAVRAVELLNADKHDIEPVAYATDSDVRVLNSHGVIDTHTRTDIPSVQLHLSDGSNRFAAIGQTSAVEK